MAKIKLEGGLWVVFDEVWYPIFSLHRWFPAACRDRGPIYAKTRSYGVYLFMHRIVTLAPPWRIVDHINGDSLDNRIANLRLCTVQENARNQGKARIAGATSRYKGVSLAKDKPNHKKRWRAKLFIDRNKPLRLGYFATEEEAALAYNVAARKYFGEFACLNDIRGCRADARQPAAG